MTVTELYKDYEFEGLDFDELALPFGLSLTLDEDLDENIIRYYLHNIVADPSRKHVKDVADCLRQFLRKLAINEKANGEYAEIWQAISKLKNDWNVINISIPLIGYMWV